MGKYIEFGCVNNRIRPRVSFLTNKSKSQMKNKSSIWRLSIPAWIHFARVNGSVQFTTFVTERNLRKFQKNHILTKKMKKGSKKWKIKKNQKMKTKDKKNEKRTKNEKKIKKKD